jgi:uncharacterized protein YhjY with autotransporter beta-barrel domain
VHTRSNKNAVSLIRLGSAFLNRLYAGASRRGYAGADNFRSSNSSGLVAARYSSRFWILAFAVLGLGATTLTSPSYAQAPNLGTAAAYAVLAGSTVTNTGPSVLIGDLGLSPGTSVTGFPPGIVTPPGTINIANAAAATAQSNLTTAYNTLAAMSGINLPGGIGNQALNPGVYNFSSSALLTGTLTLNATGPNSTFIFVVPSSLTTASASKVTVVGGGQGTDVFWVVGSSATLGPATTFVGDILALTSITLDPGATISCGSALAKNGAVTLNTNQISAGSLAPCTTPLVPVPPGTVPPVVAPIVGVLSNPAIAVPVPFLTLSTLSSAALANALMQLSGVAATGVAPTGMLAMSSFLSLVTNPFADRGLPPETTPPPLIYKTLAFNGAAPEPSRWGIWATAYGGQQNIAGDSLAGTSAWSATTVGAVMGLDYRATPYTTVGVALGGGSMNFGLSGGLGGGNGQMFQAAVYSLTRVNAAYLSVALSYGWYDMSTDRSVTLAGGGNLTAAFAANDVGGRIEGGYRFAAPGVFNLPGFGVTPYGALQGQYFIVPSYQETGASTFALAYNSQTATMIQTELGAWFDETIALDNGARLALWTRAAWAHDRWAGTDMTAAFESLPRSAFTVIGSLPGPDSLLASVGAGISFKNGISLAGEFDSQLSQGWQTYGGFARLRYTW